MFLRLHHPDERAGDSLARGRPRVLRRSREMAGVLVMALASAGLGYPASSPAVIHPATLIDGPANDIIDVGGTAMAPDGSGGIVYRKNVAGAVHLFAAQFLNGHWGPPVQVDVGNPYSVSQPAIAAGSGGRLLVVWVQPRNVNHREVTEYELMSASLQPGASSFGQAVPVDANVGEPYSGDVSAVAPELAMAPNGTAYVVYRVVLDDCGAGDELNPEEPKCHVGSTDKVVQVRVARFSYLRWSSLGAVNRAAQVAMRSPTAENAPSIGIDVNGNAIVAWQEPGADGVARIWVRRLFGTVLGNVLQASPEAIAGQAITTDAYAPAVTMSPYGEARVAYLQQGEAGSAVASTQLFLNAISSELGLKAAQLSGATPVPTASAGNPGVPNASIDVRGDFRVAWTQDGSVLALSGTDEKVASQSQIGTTSAQTALTSINPAGGGITAWVTASGQTAVAVREDYAGGGYQLAQLAGSVPGAVAGLALGAAGQGDALLGWTQGPVGQSEVVGDFVQAPPAPFVVRTASGWIRGRDADVSWEASPDSVSGVAYSVYVDGRVRMTRLTGLSARLSASALGDGVHGVQVLATDASGQQTMSSERALKVDANPPSVSVRLIDHRHGVRVLVADKASGVDRRAIRIAFGDGHQVTGKVNAANVYRRPGVYSITAQVRDKVGNHASVGVRVRVR